MSDPGAPWDLAVVGTGIAGLTAARAAAERGRRVVAYDELAPGGQLVNLGEVVGYPGLPAGTTGPDLAGALLEEAMAAGVEIAYGEVTELTAGPPLRLDTAEGPVTASAVVVATGLTPAHLDVPGASDWVGRGLSGCASCDGPLFAGKPVAVVGDDEWAAQEATELAAVAGRVTVLVSGTPHWSRARDDALGAAAVEVRTGAVPAALTGEAALAGLRLGDGTEMEVAGVFAYTGRAPRASLLDGVLVGSAEAVGDGGPDAPATGVPGLFLAGDVRAGSTPYLVSAAADGLRAGLAAVSHHG